MVGILVLVLSSWLSTLYALPEPFILAMGIANLAYGTFSLPYEIALLRFECAYVGGARTPRVALARRLGDRRLSRRILAA